MACAGDIPTMETLAAVEILRGYFPELKIRVINVVDLMTLQSSPEQDFFGAPTFAPLLSSTAEPS